MSPKISTQQKWTLASVALPMLSRKEMHQSAADNAQ